MMTIDPTMPLSDVEIRDFALELLRGPEPQCEVRPGFHGEDTCTRVAEYRLRTCKKDGNACQVAIEKVQQAVEAEHRCGDCTKPIGECWKYIAI